MTGVGFEPTRVAPHELESCALDRSANLPNHDMKVITVSSIFDRNGHANTEFQSKFSSAVSDSRIPTRA